MERLHSVIASDAGIPTRDAQAHVPAPAAVPSFDASVAALFDRHHSRLFRYLDRLSGDPELAADLAQEAFVRLLARGSLPADSVAWLITVAMNLFRNSRATRGRRRRLTTAARAEAVLADPAPEPGDAVIADHARDRVRIALDRLPERERSMLLLRAEGYGYREIAAALGLNQRSVGTLLARAKRAFCEGYDE